MPDNSVNLFKIISNQKSKEVKIKKKCNFNDLLTADYGKTQRKAKKVLTVYASVFEFQRSAQNSKLNFMIKVSIES